MTTKTIALGAEDFFHARPAALVSSAAKGFESMVMISVGVSMADAKSAIALMRLPHPRGTAFDLFADGSDEVQAVEAVEQAILGAFSSP